MSDLLDSLADELLRKGHSVRFIADGDSMDPTIRSGEALQVDPVGERRLAAGDIILARADRGLTAHRIVVVSGGSLTTRGDNALRSDPPLPFDRVLGRVVSVERNGVAIAVGRASTFPLRLRALVRALRRAVGGGAQTPRRN